MKLEDAIKSGRRFRRKGSISWSKYASEFTLTNDDILLEDAWEIEDHTVTITRSQLEAAWDEWVSPFAENNHESLTFRDFAKALGFE